MNIKEYINSLLGYQLEQLTAVPLKELFPEVSDLDLEFLEDMLGNFGAVCYLTTVKNYRKKLNLKGFASIEANLIKEISELDHEKFMELYGGGLKLPITTKTTGSPTSVGGSFSPRTAANDDRREELERAYIENTFKRTSKETKTMDPKQLANFRNIVDRVVSDIQLFYQEFLDDPSEPVMSQKTLSNFAGKEDRVRLIIAVAKPLPFALVNKETDTLESNSSHIKLGALKLFCLETISTLGQALELKEHPDAVIDGFTPGVTKGVKANASTLLANQTVALHWYIPVNEIAAIYFQVEIGFSRELLGPAGFRQVPKKKE